MSAPVGRTLSPHNRFIDRLVDVSDEAGRYHIKTPVPPPRVASWDRCEISYRVHSRAVAQITADPAFPAHWNLARIWSDSVGFRLVFEVSGEVNDRDGVIVRSLIGRLETP